MLLGHVFSRQSLYRVSLSLSPSAQHLYAELALIRRALDTVRCVVKDGFHLRLKVIWKSFVERQARETLLYTIKEVK